MITAPANIIDRIVAYFFPKAGYQRMYARWAMQSFEMTRPGRNKRPRNDLGGGGDDHLNELTLWEMREISQSIYRNNSLAKNIVDQNAMNVIGPSGWGLNVNTNDNALNEEIEQAWDEWTDSHADPSGDASFWGLLSQVYHSRLIDGDHFLQLDPSGSGCIRSIEAARVVTPLGDQGAYHVADNNRIYHGIARDRDKCPVWYFVTHDIPLNANVTIDSGMWYSASSIVPLYSPDRYSQTRGRPLLASASRDLDDIDDVLLAIRIGLKLACSQVWWMKNDDPQYPIPGNPTQTSAGKYNVDMEPGSTIHTGPGQELQLLESRQPATQTQDFIRSLMGLTGLAGGLPYELATLDFSRSTLGTNRVALQLARMGFAQQQYALTHPLNKIYRWWLNLRIKDRTFPSRTDLFRHQWTPPSWPSPFPLDDARADDIRISNGTDSRTNVARKNGIDVDRIRADQEREREWAPDAGQKAGALAGVAAGQTAGAPTGGAA